MNLNWLKKSYDKKVFLLIIISSLATLIYLGPKDKITDQKESLLIAFKLCENKPLNQDFMASVKYRCYIDTVQSGVKSQGFVETARAFDSYINTTDQLDIRSACHSWSHELGEAAVRNGVSGADIIQSCTNTCLDGCFSGAGHGYVATHPKLSGINQFCNPGSIETGNQNVATCFHGIGHGLVDVLGSDIAKDIQFCDLIESDEGRAQCSHAIFMLFNAVPQSRVDKNGIPEDVSSFCKSLGPIYQSYCYDFSGYLTYGKDTDIQKAFLNCHQVPDSNKLECLRRIGDILYLMSSQKNPQLVAKQCSSINLEESFWCSIGVAKLAITDVNSPLKQSFEICSLFQGDLKISCYREIGEQLESHLSKKDRDQLCKALDQPFSQICLGQ